MQEQSIDLNESVSWADATVEEGVIKGIKLLGEKSKNGNLYPVKTRKAAHKIMEGIMVNMNHPDRKSGADRLVESRVGKLVNVREERDGTYADFHFLTKHPFAQALVEAATRMPDLYGFSINGKGMVKKNNKGENIVESIDNLRSVDLVADPGTVKSLFESAEPDGDEPVDPDAAMAEAFCQAVVAVCKSSGDMKSKLKKIKEILSAQEKMSDKGDGEPEGGGESIAPGAPVVEAWKQEYENLKLEKTCRTLLEGHNLQVEQPLVESLMAMNSDRAREDFVNWHRRVKSVKPVRSADPVRAEIKQPNWQSILRSR